MREEFDKKLSDLIEKHKNLTEKKNAVDDLC